MKSKMEVLANQSDMSNKDKSRAIEALYKKNLRAIKGGKKEFRYIVSGKGGNAGKKAIGKGKGPTRVVDTRLKKDKRANKAADKRKK